MKRKRESDVKNDENKSKKRKTGPISGFFMGQTDYFRLNNNSLLCRISPAQALLILIEHYYNMENRSSEQELALQELIKFYMNGTKSAEDQKRLFTEYFTKDILSNYTISMELEVINNDPTRRYFESILALSVLEKELDSLDICFLRNYVARWEGYLRSLEGYGHDENYSYDEDCSHDEDCGEELYARYENVMEGDILHEELKNESIFEEYHDHAKRLREKTLFKDFSQESREKILLILKASILPMFYDDIACSLFDDMLNYTEMPLNIYEKGYFSKEEKGRILLPLSEDEDERNHSRHTTNQYWGLMKGYMALNDDVLLAHKVFPYIKPSDKATYDKKASWVIENFKRWVHPYSNSISGTVLCQLRALLHFISQNNLQKDFTEKTHLTCLDSHEQFISFFKVFISTLLFCSGGHSLYEFIAPLNLDEVKQAFNAFHITCIKWDEIDLHHMFQSHSDATKHALEKAFIYNQYDLRRKKLNLEINKAGVLIKTPPNKALSFLKSKQLIASMEEQLKYFEQNHTTTIDFQPFINNLTETIDSMQWEKAIQQCLVIIILLPLDQEQEIKRIKAVWITLESLKLKRSYQPDLIKYLELLSSRDNLSFLISVQLEFLQSYMDSHLSPLPFLEMEMIYSNINLQQFDAAIENCNSILQAPLPQDIFVCIEKLKEHLSKLNEPKQKQLELSPLLSQGFFNMPGGAYHMVPESSSRYQQDDFTHSILSQTFEQFV